MGAAFFMGTYIHEVPTRVRGVIVMDKTAFFTMPSGLYVVSAAADGLRAGCVINTAVQVTSTPPRISIAVNKDNVTSSVIASMRRREEDREFQMRMDWAGTLRKMERMRRRMSM